MNVFPVVAHSKVPAIKGWQQSAKPIGQWSGPVVTGRWAAPTGAANGFDVLDVDPRHGGLESLKALPGVMPVTFATSTPSGGWHYRFKHVPGLTNSAGLLGPGLDIRADGGYVLVDPTEGYVDHPAGVAELPVAWLAMLVGTAGQRAASYDEPIRNPVEHFRRALAEAIREIAEAPPGTRDHCMNRNAYGIGRLLEAAGADEFKVARELIDTCVKAGYDIVKANACIPRALRDGMANPREVAAAMALPVQSGDKSAACLQQLLPLPDKTKDKPAYQAWMSTLRNACDAKLVLIQYDQSRLLYERIGDRQVEVLGTSLVQAGAVTSIGESAGLLVPPSVAESMAHAYLVQAHASRENPSLFDKGSGLYRWKSPEVKEGPTPNWDYFLSRLSDPEAFLAHVWSAFEPRFEGRQAMWLQGEGNDGKSIAIQAILKGAGFSITACNDDDLMRNDKFMFSTVWDKPVILVSDSKAVNLAMQGVLHRLTGRDPIGVEYKHGPRFSAEFQGVVWITSNQRPNIEANRSNLSRLTILTLEFGDWVDGLKHRLRSEVPALLYRARDVYARACPRHFEIALNAKSLRLLKEATGYESDSFRAALQNAGLLFDAAGFVSKAEILSRLKINLQSEAPRVKSLYRWLRDQPGIKECNKGADAVPSFQGLKLT